MAYISSLKLHNFRCYTEVRMDDLAPGFVVLSGSNGAGKTNVLEALSLLSPGRGMRGAKVMEIQRVPHPHPLPEGRGIKGEGSPWAMAAHLGGVSGSVQIGTGLEPLSEKRVIRINGEHVRTQAALADYLSCVWLTPQMDRLFMDSSSHRRRFLDRLVFAFDPGHAGRVNRYDNAMAQRSRLLREGRGDMTWLAGLEAQMAETGVALAAARREFVHLLQSAMGKGGDDYFPAARLESAGTIEVLLESSPAVEVEDMFKYQLAASRARDAVTGGAATGPHKSDLKVVYATKDMAADQCSTGEQKALLIGIILAHARLIAAERGSPPILLLDEVAAHLDEGRRAALYDILGALKGQVWMTGTEESLFEGVRGAGQFFRVEAARIKEISTFSVIPAKAGIHG